MLSADSISQLLQKAYGTLPLDQSAAGTLKLETFIDALLPVMAINATPERDRIIAVETLTDAATVTGANTQIIWTTDPVPRGEIHQYDQIDAQGTIGTSNVLLQIINATSSPGVVVTSTVSQKGLSINERTNLLAVSDLNTANALVNNRFVPVLPHINVYPGGFLQITHFTMAAGDISRIRLRRIRLHGPRIDFTNLIDRLTFIEA